ncbi:YeiH family protein [Insolitispirillum peregrinum]|uniref:YeiH family protein n=1 Tax=Insolitispirillum peregrinum TaxID=80876 RepID=UPI003615F6E4
MAASPTACPVPTADAPRRYGPWAGLALSGALAVGASELHRLPALGWASPLILAVVLGIALNSVRRQPVASLPLFAPGIALVMKRLLRIGVALLGLQITLGQMQALGWSGGALIVGTVAATFVFTLGCGRLLRVEARLTRLIAAGTSICGASAVVAANAAVEGDDADVAYAVAMVTVFGTLSMLGFPLLAGLIGLGDHAFGLWSGVAIHEVAQVIAAAYQYSPQAGEMATITKLARVVLVVPVVFVLLLALPARAAGQVGPTRSAGQAGGAGRRVTIPWFALGFLALVGVASCDILPPVVLDGVATVDRWLLTVALAGMGLATAPAALVRRGGRPMLLAALATVFISLFSLGGVLIME